MYTEFYKYTYYILILSFYLDTLIIGHQFCSMLGMPNEITLQKELQNIMTNNVFGKKV